MEIERRIEKAVDLLDLEKAQRWSRFAIPVKMRQEIHSYSKRRGVEPGTPTGKLSMNASWRHIAGKTGGSPLGEAHRFWRDYDKRSGRLARRIRATRRKWKARQARKRPR